MYVAIELMGKGIVGTTDYLADEITIYAGIYGTPSYLVWYLAPDKTKQLYVGLMFRAIVHGDKKIAFYDEFIVKSAIYDVTTKMFKVYAESFVFDYLVNNSTEIPTRIWATKRDDPKSGKLILKEIIENSCAAKVEFVEPLIDKVKYVAMSFDGGFTNIDLISKICKDNGWEWYLRADTLFLSNAFYLKDQYVTLTKGSWEHQKFISNDSFTSVTMGAGLCEPGARFGKYSRVVWVIYHVGGNIGDQMTFMAYNFRDAHLPEDDFTNTLPRGISRELGLHRLTKNYNQSPVILGKIYDDIQPINIEQYEARNFGGDVRNSTNDLNTLEFTTKYVGDEKKLIGAENVKMTTPYAGDGVGILFPQEDSHAVLFSPNGDREMPLVGPRYFGHNDNVPVRDSAKDFRLQVPGGVIYIKENYEIIIEQTSDGTTVPSGTENSIKIDNMGNITIKSAGSITLDAAGAVAIDGIATNIQGGANTLSHGTHQHMVGNIGVPIPPHLPTDGTITTKAD